jgi:hypothetical protein
MYRVLPCPLTKAFPRSPTDATLTVTPFAPVVLGDVLGPDVPVEPVLAHAASNTARTAPKPADKKMGRLVLMVSPSSEVGEMIRFMVLRLPGTSGLQLRAS